MDTEDLDSTVWEQLPFVLLENILTKLPLCALMTWCRVCKRLKALIQSREFARRCDSVQPLAFFHYVKSKDPRHVEAYLDYGPDDDNLGSAPYLAIPNTKTNTWEKHTLNFASGPVTVVAADQGLICFESQYSKHTLFIYNPPTRQWKELRIPVRGKDWQLEAEIPVLDDGPKLRRFNKVECKLVGLIVDQEMGNYKVVVGWIKVQLMTYGNQPLYEFRKKPRKPRMTLIYDSDSSTWTATAVYPGLPVEDELIPRWESSWKPGASVRCGENLYWLVEEAYAPYGTAFRFIVRFDVKAGIWTADEPDLPVCRRFLDSMI